MPVLPANLGQKVSTRQTSWADLAHRAWGSEFYTPDPGTYAFSNGRKFESTDKFRTGLYGIPVDEPLLLDGTQYPDMRDALDIAPPPGYDQLNQILPAGFHDELGSDPKGPRNTNLDPARQYPK